jgi:hypothetical protein
LWTLSRASSLLLPVLRLPAFWAVSRNGLRPR